MRLFTMIMMLLTWTLSKRDNDNVDKNDDVDQDDNDKSNNDDMLLTCTLSQRDGGKAVDSTKFPAPLVVFTLNLAIEVSD